MKASASPVCLVIADSSQSNRISSELKAGYLIIQRRFHEDFALLENPPPQCVVLSIRSDGEVPERLIGQLKEQFPTTPLITVMGCRDFEKIRKCGALGVDAVVHETEITQVKVKIQDLVSSSCAKIRLRDFNIRPQDYPPKLQRMLGLIEEAYIALLGTQEIADTLGLSEGAVTKEFKSHGLTGPKKLLMYFKVRHAINLMGNEKFSLKYIASASGFTSEKRFHECVYRIFSLSPGGLRQHMKQHDLTDYWEQLVNREIEVPAKN